MVEIPGKEDYDQLLYEVVCLRAEVKEALSRFMEVNATEGKGGIASEYISAIQFMKAVDIGRWKFDQLIAGNKIKTIKKTRKIYVPRSEIQRYFNSPDIP